MSVTYPLRFSPPPAKRNLAEVPSNTSIPTEPRFRVSLVARAGQETRRFRLAEVGGWPETKVVMEQACVDLPFGGRICTDVPRLYTRTCTKLIYVDVTYPAGAVADIEDCVRGAAVAAAIAAIVSSGGAGAAAFEAALKGCLAAKGAAWADQVSATAGIDSECGEWHPV